MVIMIYKIAMNTELANNKLLLLGEIRLSSYKPLFMTLPVSRLHKNLLYVCFCLKTLFTIYC